MGELRFHGFVGAKIATEIRGWLGSRLREVSMRMEKRRLVVDQCK